MKHDLVAAGQQLFYSSLTALISDVAAKAPRDRSFALVSMARSGCFGIGGLLGGWLLADAGSAGARLVVGADAASFLACAIVLALFVRIENASPTGNKGPTAAEHACCRDSDDRKLGAAGHDGRRPAWVDRQLLALMGATAAIALATDFLLGGMSVYVINQLHAQPWLPGVILTVNTLLDSVGGTLALRLTRGLARTTTMALGGTLIVAWCTTNVAALLLPSSWRPVDLLGSAVLLAAGNLLFGARANGMAVDLAPAAVRGRRLAIFQYSYTVPGVLAPGVVALFTVAAWLPWLVVAVGAGLSAVALPALGRRLPAHVVRPEHTMATRDRS